MIRKLLCWLGWHEWIPQPNKGCLKECEWFLKHQQRCDDCHFAVTICRYCGKLRK